MTFTSGVIAPYPSHHLSTFAGESLGGIRYGAPNQTASNATWPSANRAFYWPFYVSRPYDISRLFWLNGGTTGTNFFQLAIYDWDFKLIVSTPKTLSAGTINALAYSNTGIAGHQLDSAGSSTDASTYATNSVSILARPGLTYLMAVENSHGSSASAVSAITGGPTFASRGTVQFNSNLNRVSIWSAVPTSDYTGTLTIDFGGTTQTGCCYSLAAFSNVDTTTNDGVVQTATGTGNSTTPLATLAAFGSADNGTFGAFGQAAAANGTPSTSYWELGDVTAATPAQSLQTDYRPDNDTTVDETITSAQWGAVAAELKSRGTGIWTLPPGQYWFGMWGNGTTATITRLTTVAMQMYGYLQNSLTSGLPLTATPATQAGSSSFPIAGITSRSSP